MGWRVLRCLPVPTASTPSSTCGVTYPSLPRARAICRDPRQGPRQQVSVLTHPCPGTRGSRSFFFLFYIMLFPEHIFHLLLS